MSTPEPLKERRQWVEDRRDDLTGDADEHRWRRGLFSGSSRHDTAWRSRHWASRSLHRVGDGVANAAAGVVAASVVVGWMVVGVAAGFPTWWATGLYVMTGSVTFVMVFVIQHTQSRQITALQRKLDELVRATRDADQSLIAVEEAPDEELQALADLTSVTGPRRNRVELYRASRREPPADPLVRSDPVHRLQELRATFGAFSRC